MENTENTEEKKESVESERKNILIVEDDDVIRKLLAIEFKRKGHIVHDYTDAAAAMLEIERDKPRIDSAIVDLMNMGYGGNMGDYLKRFPEYKSTMIIYYTALMQSQFNTKILDSPNTYYIHKLPGSIKTVVDKAIEGI